MIGQTADTFCKRPLAEDSSVCMQVLCKPWLGPGNVQRTQPKGVIAGNVSSERILSGQNGL